MDEKKGGDGRKWVEEEYGGEDKSGGEGKIWAKKNGAKTNDTDSIVICSVYLIFTLALLFVKQIQQIHPFLERLFTC